MSVGPKTSLTISTNTTTADGMGGVSYTWSNGKTIEGVLSILSDRERMMYGKKGEGCDYKFIVDYIFSSAVETVDRFVLGSRVFDITSKENPMNQNRLCIFLLTEAVNG